MGGSEPALCLQTGLFLAQNGISLYFCKAGTQSAQIPAKRCHGGHSISLHKHPDHAEVRSLQGVLSTSCVMCRSVPHGNPAMYKLDIYSKCTTSHCPGHHGPGVSGGPSPGAGTLKTFTPLHYSWNCFIYLIRLIAV